MPNYQKPARTLTPYNTVYVVGRSNNKIHIGCQHTYSRDGGGVFITQAIHTIDLTLSLTGPVSQVQAMTATTPLHKMEAEDFAVVGLHFASGAIGSMDASTANYPHGKESITLHGVNGSLKLHTDAMDIFWRDGRCDSYKPDIPSDELCDSKSVWHKRVKCPLHGFVLCFSVGDISQLQAPMQFRLVFLFSPTFSQMSSGSFFNA